MFKKKLDDLIDPEAPASSVFRGIVRRMVKSGVKFKQGMRQSSINVIEERSGFRFPVDLREFWSVAVPVGPDWIDWERSPPSVQEVEDWLTRALLFDAQNSGFWPDDLGSGPEKQADVETELRQWIRKGPQLIPLFSHRAMVGEPLNAGNPVLSIWQSDWIYYGWDLPSYLEHEFLGRALDYANPPAIKSIAQWEQVVG